MRPSRVKRRWDEGKPVLATAAHFTDPQSAELIGLMGFDCLWIDLEHQPTGFGTFTNMVRAARVGDMDVMARAAKGEFMRTARIVEAGVNVVMYPRCESADEARQLVAHTKFPPLGERGFFSASPDCPYSLTPMEDYLREANEQTVLMAQVESPHAVTQARAMAEVEGIDVIFFGPGDFSVMSVAPGKFGAKVLQDALAETAKQALAAGKRFGTMAPRFEDVQRALDLGASLVAFGADLHFVRAALVKMREEMGAMGFGFNPIAHQSNDALV